MATAIDAFKAALGQPTYPGEPPLVFPAVWAQGIWSYFAQEAGVGYFQDGFLYLFGERVRQFTPVLDHWSFLFPDSRERWVIGKNAYGALLVLEEPTTEGTKGRVGLVDPLEVRYITDPNLTFMSLLGRWLPENLLPRFLEGSVYDQWLADQGGTLGLEEILAIKKPLSLGGKMVMDNFQVEYMVPYYATTGPLYRNALNNEK